MHRFWNSIWLLAFAPVLLVVARSDTDPISMSLVIFSTTATATEAEVEQSTLMTSATTISRALPPIVKSPLLVSSQAPLSERSVATHIIKVGPGAENKFEPAKLPDIPIGDVVSFEFYPKGHSVARADFEKPCVPYESNGADRSGFWSGEQLLEAGTSSFDVTINSTEPVFFYCAAKDSCLKHLMVGVINPNGTQTLEGQILAAKMATQQLAPGEPVPPEDGSTPTPSASSSPDVHGGHQHGLSTAAIVGISVGAGAFLVVCAALFFFVGRLKSLKELVRHHGHDSAAKPQGVGSVHPEPYYRHSTFSQSPPPPQGEYPPAFGSPSPAYAGPHISMKRMPSHNGRKSSQPMAAELHSPTHGKQGFSAELEASNVSSKWHG